LNLLNLALNTSNPFAFKTPKMGPIKERILELLEQRKRLTLGELFSSLRVHPKVLEVLLKELEKEGKVRKIKEKKPHNPKKYRVYFEA
jgi:DNA-binding Lrp family transcriptional regulator